MVLSNACGMLTVNHIHQLCQNCLSSTADLVYTHLLPDPVHNLNYLPSQYQMFLGSWFVNITLKSKLPSETSRAQYFQYQIHRQKKGNFPAVTFGLVMRMIVTGQTSRVVTAPILPVSNTQTKKGIFPSSHIWFVMRMILSRGGERGDPFVPPVHECTC